jgi:hypothetical protein
MLRAWGRRGWYGALLQRAAFRKHVLIPFEEQRGRQLDQ